MPKQNILTIPMQENDAGAKTIGEYLMKLAKKVWDRGEGFSGKRPFGNSGWRREIYKAIGAAGAATNALQADKLISDVLDGFEILDRKVLTEAMLKECFEKAYGEGAVEDLDLDLHMDVFHEAILRATGELK